MQLFATFCVKGEVSFLFMTIYADNFPPPLRIPYAVVIPEDGGVGRNM
jgi:hypothetical protein